MVTYIPKQRDVVWLDFDPQQGKDIKKRRPAIVISPYEYNLKTSLALFMPITSKIKGYPFEVLFSIKTLDGAILSDQILSLDWRARQATFICQIPEIVFLETLSKFSTLLSINN